MSICETVFPKGCRWWGLGVYLMRRLSTWSRPFIRKHSSYLLASSSRRRSHTHHHVRFSFVHPQPSCRWWFPTTIIITTHSPRSSPVSTDVFFVRPNDDDLFFVDVAVSYFISISNDHDDSQKFSPTDRNFFSRG